MSMQYAVVTETEGLEEVKYIRGTKELEYLTDARIMAIYGTIAILIYKLYEDCSAVVLKGEDYGL